MVAIGQPARWQARYSAAAAQLMDLQALLAVRAALAPEGPDEAPPLRWLGEAQALGSEARVGVLAGSFNPLTLAHTALMRTAASTLRLSAVVWACSRITVDKEGVERATLVDRLIQLQAYLLAGRRVSGLVVLRAGLYADQAVALRAALPPNARLWLIAGYDKVEQIFDARYYADRDAALRRLFQAADLAVAPRGVHDAADLAALLARPRNRDYAPQVRMLPSRPEHADLSSTAARALAARGALVPELIRYLEPEGAALARRTGAYGPLLALPSGEAIDVYALRQAVIERLAAHSPAPDADMFERLLDLAAAPTSAGARLRQSLVREREAQ